MQKQNEQSKLNRIAECLKARDYSNPELTGAKIISLCVILSLLLCILIFVTRISQIEIKGDVSVFSETEIVEASSLKVGGCLYSKPFFAIKKSIRENLPMVEKISVRKKFFTHKVTIKVEFSDFEYFIYYGDKLYGVDSDLRVTDVRQSALEFSALGARALTLPKVEEPTLGSTLIFSDTLDVRDEDGYLIKRGAPASKFDYVTALLSFLKDNGYMSRVDGVFLDEKFNIRIILDERYLVYVGKCDALETKFEVLEAIIAEGSTDYGNTVIINVQNPALASARVENGMDLEALCEQELLENNKIQQPTTPSETHTESVSEVITEPTTETATEVATETSTGVATETGE